MPVLAGGIGGFVTLFVAGALGIDDQALFLRSIEAAGSLQAQATAMPLATVLLLAVNGFVVPVAEERLWRGVVQTALVKARSPLAGIAVTAIVFSLKHAVVDGSPGRLLALIGFGLVAGSVRWRWGTGASTVAHIVANVIATLMVLL